MSEIHYVNLNTGRIVVDPKTIEAPDTQADYVAMDSDTYHEYCIEQRRKLDAAKQAHREAEEEFNAAEDVRVSNLANQIATTLGISQEDALSMVPRQQYAEAPNFSVSEKVFGDIVLPEEEG